MNVIYLDNAATTRTDPEVVEAMLPWLTDEFGSPSTLYTLGSQAKQALETTRESLGDLVGAGANEIFFTSGATESNNWAIKGVADALQSKGRHIITSQAEHHSILMPCKYLEKRGWEVTYLPVDSDGAIDPVELESAIRDDTVLVTIAHANHEIGTIQPVTDISAVTRDRGVALHINAAQTVGHLPVDIDALGCDLLSLSAHKFYGPKGAGALYIRRGTRLTPLIHGGSQEKKRRAGTQNVPAIAGMGKAARMARKNLPAEVDRLTSLRDYTIESIENNMEDVRLNGHRAERLPNNVNFCIEGIEGESIMLSLSYPTGSDEKPVFISTGSACVSGSLEPSHILLAIGVPAELAHGSVRLSLAKDNTREDIDYALRVLFKVTDRLRSMSPVYKRTANEGASKSATANCDECEAAG